MFSLPLPFSQKFFCALRCCRRSTSFTPPPPKKKDCWVESCKSILGFLQGMSKQGSLRLFLTWLQSSLLRNIGHTAQKAMSFGFVCQQSRKDCHVASSQPLLALWLSKNRPDILFRVLSAHAKAFCAFSIIVSTATLLIYQKGMSSSLQSLILSTDSNFPFSPLPFCLSFFLGYPKGKVPNSCGACCWLRRFVLLETRGLSPESDGRLPRKLKGQRSGLHLILSYILTQGFYIQLGNDVHFRDN